MNKYKVMAAILSMASVHTYALSGDDWSLSGRLKYGESIAYDLDEESNVSGPKSFLGEVNFNWFPTDTIVVAASFWYRGDLNPNNGDDMRQYGLMDYTAPNYLDRFGFNVNGKPSGFPEEPFGAEQNELKTLDDFDNEVIRELSIKYTDIDGRFAAKIGKFQRGWGQSDGLRLIDVLHPQDLRERFVMRDAQDIRIPTWMAAIDLDLGRLGLGAPFEFIGLKRPELELIGIYEVRHSEFIVNNPTPSSATSGGLWGLPFPNLIDSTSQRGLPFIGVNLNDRIIDEESTHRDGEYGVRFKFNALGADWTLNAFKGYQDLPVLRLTGMDLIVGSSLNDPENAIAVLPFNAAQTEALAQGPYLTSLRTTNGANDLLGLLNPLISPLLGGDLSVDPVPCENPIISTVSCSINLNFDLDYTNTQEIYGFSFIRDISEIGFGPRNVSPVLRVEFSKENDKAFNRAIVTNSYGIQEEGTTALVALPSNSITYRDQYSLMVGFDYFLWIPGWESQRKSIFTSFQFFNIHTDNGEELFYQAPYSANGSRLPENHNYATLLWSHGFFNEKLAVESLSIWDLDFDGYQHRARLDFNFFGNTIRPRIEWVHVDGEDEQGVIGIFNKSDYVEASLTIQF